MSAFQFERLTQRPRQQPLKTRRLDQRTAQARRAHVRYGIGYGQVLNHPGPKSFCHNDSRNRQRAYPPAALKPMPVFLRIRAWRSLNRAGTPEYPVRPAILWTLYQEKPAITATPAENSGNPERNALNANMEAMASAPQVMSSVLNDVQRNPEARQSSRVMIGNTTQLEIVEARPTNSSLQE